MKLIISIFLLLFSISVNGQLLGGQIKPQNITTVVFTSDPQYPWYDGIPEGLNNNEYDKKNQANSERMIREQYQDINKLNREIGVAAVIINGDLTAFGHKYQLDKMKELLKTLEVDYYIGLGNHDYENNIHDTFNDQAARRMAEYLISWQNERGFTSPEVRHLETNNYYNFPEYRYIYNGSLAYSFNIGNLHFVQLNNYPLYTVSWNSWIGGVSREYYNIGPSLDWLDNNLKKAREEGKHIIINMHDADLGKANDRYHEILDKYDVSAVFAGHFHAINGIYVYHGKEKKIPVYLSGAASYQDYLTVEFNLSKKKARVFRRIQRPDSNEYKKEKIYDSNNDTEDKRVSEFILK